MPIACAPLGILQLAAALRQYFGERVTVHFWDMNIYQIAPDRLAEKLGEFEPDVVAVSALNIEASASFRIAELAKAWREDVLTVLGGPLVLRQAPLCLRESRFDWAFEGAADRTFAQALERHFSGSPLEQDLPGFNYRRPDGSLCLQHGQDLITDLDSLPLPAWHLLDFDRYRRRDRKRIITNVGERRYAFLFTSRGCPYLCNYCHDIFTKRFVYRSVENVIEEMKLLYHTYGVREFHIVDDIFNLHRPRVKALMQRIRETFDDDIYLAFPNGLRGDILDAETIAAMVEGGTYHATISIETVTPRLQSLVEKHLEIDKAMWAIDEFARHGVIVQGAFMVGFPTETPEEIEATISYAIHSSLTHAFFFAVIPQPQTPIYELAASESLQATEALAHDERHMSYAARNPWYTRAYGYDLERKIGRAYLRFYLHPPRLLRILRNYSVENLAFGAYDTLRRLVRSLSGIAQGPEPPAPTSDNHGAGKPMAQQMPGTATSGKSVAQDVLQDVAELARE